MRSVVFIAYFFPPEGNAGTYRPLRFVRSLSKIGWSIRVISVDPYYYERYDPQLLTLIPQATEVIRVRGRDMWLAFQGWRTRRSKAGRPGVTSDKLEKTHTAQNASFRSFLRAAVRKIEACYYLPDIAKPWIQPAVETTMHSSLSNPPQVIWATVGPVSAGVVAQQASERIGVPYVLDFRDPWGLNYYPTDKIRPKFATRMNWRIMYRILERAQAVIFLFDTLAECYWREYKGALDPAKIHIIPNGYEGILDEFQTPTTEKCTILYAGTLSTYRYDTLLDGLNAFKENHSHLAKKMRLLFVGDGNAQMMREAKILGLSDMVETMEAVSYEKILFLQKEAHAFLILGREPNRKGHELVAGAKLFGYLQARRPIIGVLPNDETKRILQQVGVSTIANVENSEEIASVFQRVLKAWNEGDLFSILPDQSACEVYSSERQAVALTRALEGRSAIEPFIPGKVDIPPSFKKEFCR